MMGSRKKFAVVQFVEEGSIEYVPYKWLSEDTTKCSYPLGPKAAKLRLDPESFPDLSWPKYSINLKYVTDKIQKANRQADLLQFTSTVESSDSELAKKNRRDFAQNNRIFGVPTASKTLLPIFDVLGESQRFEESTPVRGSEKQQSLLFSLEPPQDPNVGFSITSNEAPSVIPLDGNLSKTISTIFKSPTTSGSTGDQGDFSHGSEVELFSTRPLSNFMEIFERFKKKVFEELHEIKAELEVIRSNSVRQNSGSTECPIKIPIGSREDLEVAELQLQDKSIQRLLCKWAAQIGGVEYKAHARRLLKLVFTHEMSRNLNFTGRNDKCAFERLQLAESIISGVVTSHDVQRNQVELVCKNWFRYSGDHQGGREKRRAT